MDCNADKPLSPAFEHGNAAQLLEGRVLQTPLNLTLFAPIITLLCFYREKSGACADELHEDQLPSLTNVSSACCCEAFK